MVGILIFESVFKRILLFYFLTLSSNACTYISLMHVMRNYEIPEGKALKNRVKKYYYMMNLIYFSMFLVTSIPSFTPVCSNLSTYPRIMYSGNVLFLVNACFFWIMYMNNFFFDLSEPVYQKSILVEP